MILDDKNKKIIFFSGLFLFLIPFLSFLKINTYEIIDQFKFVYSLLLISLFIIFLFISILIFKITKINFLIIFFFLNFFFFIQSYFNSISILFENSGIRNGASLETLIFIFLLFFSLIIFQYKKNNLFFKFFLIFTLLNVINHSFVIVKKIYQGGYFNTALHSKNSIEIKKNLIVGNNMYLVFLDGMVSLEKFNDYFDIDIDKIKKNLESKNLEYVDGAKSIATSTRLTFASFFNLNPVTLDHKVFKNRPKNLFPGPIDNSNLLKILEINNYKFNWIGNDWLDCVNYNSEYCITNKNSLGEKFIGISSQTYFINVFFQKTLIYKLFLKSRSFFEKTKSYDSDPSIHNFMYKNALRNFNYFYSKINIPTHNNFYFIHNLAPHPPFIFDKECNYKETETFINTETNFKLNGYRDNYICAYKDLINFLNLVKKKDPKSNILIIGDHGWDLAKNNDENKKISSKYDIFLANSFNSNCELDSNNLINLNYFKKSINCLFNTTLDYSDETQYYEKNNKIFTYK